MMTSVVNKRVAGALLILFLLPFLATAAATSSNSNTPVVSDSRNTSLVRSSMTCGDLVRFKATSVGENSAQYNAFVAEIGETPDVLIDFEGYSDGDNLEGIVIGDFGATLTNLEGDFIEATDDPASADPIGRIAALIDDGGNGGDDASLSFTMPVDYVGLYFIDIDGSGTFDITVRFSDGTTCTFPVDETASNCQCEEFFGVAAINGKMISSVSFFPDGGSQYAVDNIVYGKYPVSTTPNYDLALMKNLGPGQPSQVMPGDNVAYTIKITNEGNVNSGAFSVSDVLPPNTTFVSASGTGFACVSASNTITCAYSGSLGVSSMASFDVVLNVNGAIAPSSTITNCSEIRTDSGDDSDSNPGNGVETEDDYDCATVTINPPNKITNCAEVVQATGDDVDSTPGNGDPTEDDYSCFMLMLMNEPDLSINKTVDNANPIVGGNVVFTITVTNSSDVDAPDVVVSEMLGTGLAYVSHTTSTGSYDPGAGLWTIPLVPANSDVTLMITAQITSSTTIENCAEIILAGLGDPDSVPGDGMGDDYVCIVITPDEPLIDLSVEKTANVTTVLPGEPFSYTITVTNSGPQAATDVVLTDQLPAGVTYIGSVPSQGSYDPGTGFWTVGTLPIGGSATLVINVTAN